MHFAGVDIPQKLITAHAQGDVVFFVGAGASMSPPTNLPNFVGLTKRVAKRTGFEPNEDELKEPDVYLGHLDSHLDIDVHGLVEQEIRRGRRRNSLHDALVTVAAAPGGDVRLVTTNFDNHLARALHAQGINVTVFEAPALPAGNDFEGLVHLHGRLGQPARRLVVTDSDFGGAYVTRGWAPAFLRDLFARFVVCFVGYSHEDRMMEYLAKGLPSDAQDRFIITDVDAKDRWRRLNLTPILYPYKEYGVVVDALRGWGKWAHDTPLDHATRIRSLAGKSPPADPDEDDFLASCLRDPRLAAEVGKIATSREWVDWMFQQPPVRELLAIRSSGKTSPHLVPLAEWVAGLGVGQEYFQQVYSAVSESGQTVNETLIAEVVRRLTDDHVDTARVSAWLRWVLAQNRPGSVRGDDLEALWGTAVQLPWADTLLLLDYLANRWELEGGSLFGGVQRPRVQWGWAFNRGAQRLSPSSAHERREMLGWLTAYFELAHLRFTEQTRGFDPWAFRRSSIAPHKQDARSAREAESTLIDVARDTLARTHESEPSAAATFLEGWLSSRAPLLRRLAVHDLTAYPSLPPAARVAALVDRDMLFSSGLHHEVYSLLANAVPELEDDAFEGLLTTVSRGPEPEPAPVADDGWRQSVRDRKVYNLLHWLLKHRPEALPPKELERIQLFYPEWGPDEEHPDLTHSMKSGSSSIEDEWPWQPEELHQMIHEGPTSVAGAVLAASPLDEHGWWPGGDLVRHTIECWPEDGFMLWPSAPREVRECVISGWSTAQLSDGLMDEVAVVLAEAHLSGLERQVAWLLRPPSNDPAIRERWVARLDGRALARRAFAALSETEPSQDGDLYIQAINSTPGILVEYWIGVAVHEARTGTYPGGGLSESVTQALGDLLHPSTFLPLVQAPLVGQLNFFLRADPAWTERHLLTAIDPTSHAWSEVEGLWAVVLNSQIGEELLQAGLREWLLVVAQAVDSASRLAEDVAHVVALVAVHSTMGDSTRMDWLRTFVVNAAVETRVRWIHEVTRLVAELEPNARASLWRRWLKPFVDLRVHKTPRVLLADEATALVGWIGLLNESADVHDGVDRILSTGLGLASHEAPWHGLEMPEDSLSAHPNEWARLIAGMLGPTQALPPGLRWRLDRAHVTLETAGADTALVKAIGNHLYRLAV